MVGRWGSRVALAVLAALIVLLTSGCLRAQVAAAVRSDDTVTGEMVLAQVVTAETEPGAVVVPPEALASRVRAQPYRQDGYAGTRLLFENLTFDEFGALAESEGAQGDRMSFELRRAGDLVLFTGRVDLTEVAAPDRVDVTVRLSFPGRVTATNGQQSGNEVSWRPAPGERTDLDATARYADPGARPWREWAYLVGGGVGVVALLVVVLAIVSHRMSARQRAG